MPAIPFRIYAMLAGGVAFVLLCGWIVLAIRDSAVQAERAARAQKTIEAFQNRRSVDNETASRDDVGLCIDLGGLPAECRELRRVFPNAAP
jgi:hypothetical protein